MDHCSLLSLKNQLRNLVTRQGRQRLLINFTDVEYINSTMVGTFVGVQHLVLNRGGELAFCCIRPRLRRIFDLIGASKILAIFDSEEEALAHLRGSSAVE